MKKKWGILSILFTLCFVMFGFATKAEEAESFDSYPPKSEWTDAKYFTFDASTGTIVSYSLDGPKDVVIPAEIDGVAVRHIGKEAFYKYDNNLEGNLYEIRSVKFPRSLTTIGRSAFFQNHLTYVEFPNSLQIIGNKAFAENQLTQVQFPEGLILIGRSAFFVNKLTQVYFPDSLQKISEWAFANNQLSQAKLPKGCDVPVNAFDSGVEVHRPEGEPSRLFIFDASTGTILKYSINGPKDVVIPSKIDGVTVRHIGEKAFYEEESGRNIYQIQNVKFPEELTSIGAWAFYENLLTHVEFPKNLISIGAWAFGNNQLTQVEFPKNLTSIGAWAFADNQLTQVKFSEGLTFIDEYTFVHNQLTQVQFPEGLTYIEYAAFTDNQLTEVEIPEGCEVHPEAFDRQVIVRRRKGGVQPIPVPNKEDLFADKVISDPVYSWTVTFNIALDPSTVNEQNFFIQDAEGNILTGIEPTLIDGTKVRFVNQKSFEKNKDYYLVIKKGVRGHGNTILAKNVILKFRVE